jgi:hypothetical protein
VVLRERKTNADAIRDCERDTYYAGEWKPEYERWVDMLAGLNAGPGKNLVAWNSAAIYDMLARVGPSSGTVAGQA